MSSAKTVKRERRITQERSADFKTFYANQVGVLTSPFDLSFSFGRIVRADEGELRAMHEIQVYMSPQHAKAFLNLLSGQMQIYESLYGTVPDVESISAADTGER